MLPLAIGLFCPSCLEKTYLPSTWIGPGHLPCVAEAPGAAVPRAVSGVLVFPGCHCQWPGNGYGRTERGRGGNGPGTLAWKLSFLE